MTWLLTFIGIAIVALLVLMAVVVYTEPTEPTPPKNEIKIYGNDKEFTLRKDDEK